MLTTDRIAGSILAFFALGVIWESRNLPFGTFRNPGPAYMPVLLASALLGFSLVVALTGGRSERLPSISWKEFPHAAAILAACIFSAIGMERLGYRLTILLATGFLLKAVERKSWFFVVTLALALAFGTFYVFYTLLRVPLPFGPFGI